MSVKGQIKIEIHKKSCKSVNSIDIKNRQVVDSQEPIIEALTTKFTKLFADPEERLTYIMKVVGEIRTNTDLPVYSPYYPFPMSQKSEKKAQIEGLSEDGIIRPSRSSYNTPIGIVPKKTDSQRRKQYRMVINYRKLNSVTIADR